MKNQAKTLTEKELRAKCHLCSHFWKRNDYETCTNEENKDSYGKKKKQGKLNVCDYYDEC